MLTTIFTLLVIYQLKHFLCDYPFQVDWMLGKFLTGYKWIVPLAAHAVVHGLATFLIARLFNASFLLALSLCGIDFTIHFVMDRIKASPNLMGRWKALTGPEWVKYKAEASPWSKGRQRRTLANQKLLGNKLFWICLGIDQLIHHLTHYACIYILLMYR